MAWHRIADETAKHTDPDGLQYVKILRNEIDPFDKALRNNDLKTAAKILRKVIPYTRRLIPHLNNTYLQIAFKGLTDRNEKFLGTFDSDGATISSLNTFLVNESKNLDGILGAIVDTVVDLVGDVTDLLGDILGGLL